MSKNKKGQFEKNHKPWNTGLKLGKPLNNNKLPTKIVYCKCCGVAFEVRITSPQKYAPKHYQRLMSSKNNPACNPETKEKIRTTLLQTYKDRPEILENRKPCGINQFSNKYTSIEKPIADILISKNIPFIHNFKIKSYFVDFLIFENVILECDGEYWHKDKNKDYRRDAKIMKDGYYIFRLSEKDILKDPNRCVDKVFEILQYLCNYEAPKNKLTEVFPQCNLHI